ncbi:MAG: HAD-IA family hydrolase [Chitinivibrionales bacterium]|nr:HAD-IA family hydrolase [Chitinivibrionales bacterium]
MMPNMNALTNSCKAVFFDVGGTLLTPHPSVGALYAHHAARFGMHIDPQQTQQAFKQAFARSKPHRLDCEKEEKAWWIAIVKDTIHQLTPLRQFDAFFESVWNAFAQADAWRMFDDVIPALRAGKARGLHIGIVSNWDSRLPVLLRNLKLDHYIDSLSVSAQLGAAKPDGHIFKHALHQAGCLPREALHIGDLIKEDYYGAQQAGIVPVLIKRFGMCDSTYTCINSLTKLFG